MAYEPHDLKTLLAHDFDCVIDVRSPSEFAIDHVPGAINLPVLSDAQRAEVGTIYVQDSPFKARKIGAAHVARNASDHLIGPLADMTGGWRPLVYCWRGGQRSGSFASILTQVGWRAEVLSGGYRTFRSMVVNTVYEASVKCPIVLIDGHTGSAKTEVLQLLAERGHQTIDLEGLANHRGSLFGGRAGGQPSQRAFETALAVALDGLDPTQPLVLEAESSKIGDRLIPVSLWRDMKVAPRIRLVAPVEARASYLLRVYDDLVRDPEEIDRILDGLRNHHGAKMIDSWRALAREPDLTGFVLSLMEHHYDPRYRGGLRDAVARIDTAGLDHDDLVALTGKMEAEISAIMARQTAPDLSPQPAR